MIQTHLSAGQDSDADVDNGCAHSGVRGVGDQLGDWD